MGCAILGILAFGKENIDITYCNYDDVNQKVKDFVINKEYQNYDYVYITDISINEEVAELIKNTYPDNFKEGFNLCEMFELLDHHPTALFLNKYFWCTVQIEESKSKTCGTSLFYQNLNYDLIEHNDINKQNIKDFVETVRQYDTWEWKTKYNAEEPKMWNDLLYIMGRDEFISQMVYKLKMYDVFDFNSIEEMLLRIESKKKEEYFYKKSKELIKEVLIMPNYDMYSVGVVFAENYISELGNKLAEENTDLDFIIIITNCNTVSYRGIKDNIDLGKDVASVFGGGGHPKASGSQISEEIRNEILHLIFGIDA